MSSNPALSLEDAKQLVTFLENGDDDAANALLEAVALKDSMELFAEVGKLTRQLHDSLNSFQLDSRITNLANEDIPDAQDRLTYVIETTENAANTTMDAVETCMPVTEKFHGSFSELLTRWEKLMVRDIQVGEFKQLCLDVETFLKEGKEESDKVNSLLTEVLMAQGYQDLTGQVIKRVIELVSEVEDSLVNMLKVFGAPEIDEMAKRLEKEEQAHMPEGPIIDAEQRDDVVAGQDDVDDLLSSLGF